MEERAVNAERKAAKNENAQRKYEEINNNFNRLQHEYKGIVQQLETEKAKTELLTKELNNLQNENKKLKSLINFIKMKIGSLKVGLLGANKGKITELLEHLNDQQIAI